MREFRAACGEAHVKAILASGELKTLRNVAKASLVCMMAGADFPGKKGLYQRRCTCGAQIIQRNPRLIAVVEHPDTDKIAFTGSTRVGKLMREKTACFGKSPFIVFEDADLDVAIEGLVDAVWSFGSAKLSETVERNSIGNLKRTFVDYGRQID